MPWNFLILTGMCFHVSVFLNLDSSEHSKEFNHDACSLTPLISLDQMPMSTMLSEASSVKKTILIHLNPLRCLILPHHHRQWHSKDHLIKKLIYQPCLLKMNFPIISLSSSPIQWLSYKTNLNLLAKDPFKIYKHFF